MWVVSCCMLVVDCMMKGTVVSYYLKDVSYSFLTGFSPVANLLWSVVCRPLSLIKIPQQFNNPKTQTLIFAPKIKKQ